jgi:hypothetical protein
MSDPSWHVVVYWVRETGANFPKLRWGRLLTNDQGVWLIATDEDGKRDLTRSQVQLDATLLEEHHDSGSSIPFYLYQGEVPPDW